ncbi:MAG: hypothetical protein K2R93_21955 [Gemmatimonadaceae bacterium]|nr:hypothetical protein [Gemmatimonadaceae bacterium]
MVRSRLLLVTALALGACAPHGARPPAAMPDVAGEVAGADELAPDDSVPSVVVRTFRGSPYVNVLAWAGDDARYGLRSSLREDGTIARGFHSLFFSASVLRQLTMRNGGDWSVFPLGSDQGRVFAISGWFRDVHSCEGHLGCTPFEVVTARVEDELLRRSATTGLEVRVHGRSANVRTVLTLSPAVVTAYLAKFDSVAAAQRAAAR